MAQDFIAEITQGVNEYLSMDMFTVHSRLRLDNFKHVMPGDYYIMDLSGGLNGRGQFLFYMEDVSELIKMLMIRFNSVWLIKWENDCPDDLFTISIGMRF